MEIILAKYSVTLHKPIVHVFLIMLHNIFEGKNKIAAYIVNLKNIPSSYRETMFQRSLRDMCYILKRRL